MTPAPQKISQTRSRLILLLIVAMFLSSFGVAAFLRFTGWTPPQSKNFGTLLQPPVDLSPLSLVQADGKPYPWQPEKNLWRLVVVPAAGCAQACVTRLDQLHRLWLTQGRKADRIDVLWFGEVPESGVRFRRLLPMRPDASLAAALPQAATPDAVPVYLVDPSGFLVLHYAPDVGPADMKKDLSKLVK